MACFVAFQRDILPLIDTHVPTPVGELAARESRDLVATRNARLADSLRELEAVGVPREFAGFAFGVWGAAHWERAKQIIPADMLGYTSAVENLIAKQRTPWLDRATRRRALDALTDGAHAIDAAAIVEHPQVREAARTEGEAARAARRTSNESAEEARALGDLFVRLAAPSTKRGKAGVPLATKLASAKESADERDKHHCRPAKLEPNDEPKAVAAPVPTPAIDEAELARVRGALTQNQWEAILATCDTEGTTAAGKRLGKSPQAVENLVAAARKKLRKLGLDLNLKKSAEDV